VHSGEDQGLSGDLSHDFRDGDSARTDADRLTKTVSLSGDRAVDFVFARSFRSLVGGLTGRQVTEFAIGVGGFAVGEIREGLLIFCISA
jgi:hypothetical protein